MHTRTYLTILIFFSLSACVRFGEDRTPPPAQSVAELRALGVSFTPTGSSYPRSVSAACSEDGLYIGKLQGLDFYFSPRMDYANFQSVIDLTSAENEGVRFDNPNYWRAYNMVFSTQNGGEITPIEGSTLLYSTFAEQFEQHEIPNIYSYQTRLLHSHPEFIFYGDFYLGSSTFSFPVNATHVELWFSRSRVEEPELVHRVPLENLYLWRTFVQPYIDTSSGTALCNLDIS